MYRLIVVALLLIVVLPFSIQTRAQDTPKCDSSAIIKAANGLKSSGDAKKDLPTLLKLADDIHAAEIACNGFTFTGKGVKVAGPFVLPKGFYKITAITKGYLNVQAKSLTGSDCKPGEEQYLFNLSQGQGDPSAEATLNIDADCRIVLEMSNSREAWKITFESLQ